MGAGHCGGVAVKVLVDLAIKPRAGQSQEDADAEFLTLFREYLTLPEGPFQEDYGPSAWGGYDGPFVTGVTVGSEAQLEELAKLGMQFKSDTLWVHFLILCGRDDDEVTEKVNKRRMETAQKMDALAEELELTNG